MASAGVKAAGWSVIAALAAGFVVAPPWATASLPTSLTAPPRLSADHSRPDIASRKGSGKFGHWSVDRYGLPAYDYTTDELSAGRAVQPELAGSRDAWSQLGNDHVIANGFNHGYTELWSLDRDYERTNAYDAAAQHYAGGYGYLRAGRHVISTMYDDRPKHAHTQRRFGTGYYRKSVFASGVQVHETDFAPWGSAPLLLDDVTVTNRTSHPLTAKWYEYWDVDPQTQSVVSVPRGVTSPTYDAQSRTLSVGQLPSAADVTPQRIFASALDSPISGWDTDTTSFFGAGTRARPAAVVAGRTTQSVAPPSVDGVAGRTLFVFASPVHLAPGASTTLHYAYGVAASHAIGGLVRRFSNDTAALEDTERSWRSYVPLFDFGPGTAWLSRELQWDAYMLKSGESYDAACGYHIITQGGYYTFGDGVNIAYRDPLQYAAAIASVDPAVAADIIRYSAHEQPAGTGVIPYGIAPGCLRFDLGTSDDLDLYLLWATTRYVETTRDIGFLDEHVPYYQDIGNGTIWQHLELAFHHQENLVGHGPHGEYVVGATGDWSDLSTGLLQMTESDLVTVQAVYTYRQLASLAAAAGHRAFAASLRAAAARDARVVRAEWVSRGWYARGYSGLRRIGAGAIFEEPQPWAVLSGLPTRSQAIKLVANYRRFLVGVDAPKVIHGPSKIGAALTPAAADPDVTERSLPPAPDGASNFVDGAWYSPNGWMTWALSALVGEVPHAARYAWSEFVRNTLTAHADAYPNAWDGVLSVDDVCAPFFYSSPQVCGNGLSTSYDTQIYHQDAWSLFDAAQIAGITPTARGLDVRPAAPMKTYSIRERSYGIASQPGLLSGYVRPMHNGSIVVRVTVPSTKDVTVFVGSHTSRYRVRGSVVTFGMRVRAHRAADWAVRYHPAGES
ncbi:MAG TPA: hypothetical protein VG650_00630 [Mycobacteriales bacterium]|nr:hypothetical protein [Mycobacteriales bacterium]